LFGKKPVLTYVNRDSKILDFKLCTTKQLYVMVVEKLYELPICYEKWKEIFDIEETISFSHISHSS
jgi:hypothetical protein